MRGAGVDAKEIIEVKDGKNKWKWKMAMGAGVKKLISGISKEWGEEEQHPTPIFITCFLYDISPLR